MCGGGGRNQGRGLVSDLQNPVVNSHPIFQQDEDADKRITILKYLITIHPVEWDNFLQFIEAVNMEHALSEFQGMPGTVQEWGEGGGRGKGGGRGRPYNKKSSCACARHLA